MVNLYPKISIVYHHNPPIIEIRDITGIYNPEDNPTGWLQADKQTVTSAFIDILKNGVLFARVDVLHTLKQSPDSDDFLLYTIDNPNDAAYVMKYIINTNKQSKTVSFFSAEKMKIIVSKMWSELALNHDIYSRADLERECHWLEMTLLGLGALERRGLEDRWLNLFSSAELRYKNNKSKFKFNF